MFAKILIECYALRIVLNWKIRFSIKFYSSVNFFFKSVIVLIKNVLIAFNRQIKLKCIFLLLTKLQITLKTKLWLLFKIFLYMQKNNILVDIKNCIFIIFLSFRNSCLN